MSPTIVNEIVHFRHEEFAVVLVLATVLIFAPLVIFDWISVSLPNGLRLIFRIVSVATTLNRRCLEIVDIVAEFLAMAWPANFLCLAHLLVTVTVLRLNISDQSLFGLIIVV